MFNYNIYKFIFSLFLCLEELVTLNILLKHIILIIIQIFHEWKRKSILLLMVVKIFFVPSLLPYKTVLLAEQMTRASPGLHNVKKNLKLGECN